ncbi:MAG: dTDP-4-dehydrorhamnose reductase [Deltaproteobacteria bacterium]|nr:dTDP-4-dehydrorhamnose reductase [Deltaproteobacteria bacterium]MBW1953049.1 dTDP-4-dehydrorhamnose reductase [Deltaproteobacteria bacterium]MBW1985925.1 dTDP-4-dehydrorhamnose reductase [Deltaproteobacteria bacterium]MBW2133685.1 dTDP-4-dehydrorhamnose reductase [Deltaproteobacteria bacterium]
MQILITGSDGQLGRTLVQEGTSRGFVIRATDLAQLDITNCQAVLAEVEDYRPEVLINAAAYTQVDDCETQIDLAYRVNALGPRNLGLACRRFGVRLVHISTDYVFDGQKASPYVEWDSPRPLSVYGESKLLGEQQVREQCPDHFIVRTAWLYGPQGQNFIKTVLARGRELASQERPLKVVHDQHGTPTSTLALARQLFDLAETNAFGTYHATCQGACTWYEFAWQIITAAGLPVDLKPCTTAEFPRPAPRPRNSVLANRVLQLEQLDHMPDWQTAFAEFWQLYGRQL